MTTSTMRIATAYVEIKPDTSNFKSSVEREAKSTASEVGKQFAQLFGAAAFGMGLRKSINDASDLNETVSKTKVIFGDAADEMMRTAETAAKTMGMSKKAYLDSAAGLKGLLDNMGLTADASTEWTSKMVALGSDLASFFNTDPADAVYAISAALRGESEPLRRYNVQLSEVALKSKAMELGLYSGKGALELNAKAQAALALITEQTSTAQGDFIRTADGVANSTRITKAEMENASASVGQSFLPVYQRVVTIVGTIAGAFASLPVPVQTATIALLGFVMLSGPMSTTVTVIKSAITAIQGLSTASKVGLGVLGLLITVAGTLYGVFSGGDEETQPVTDATYALADSLKASTAELLTNVDAVRALKGELPNMTTGYTALSDAVVTLMNQQQAGSGDEFVKALGAMGLTAKDAAVMMDVLGTSVMEANYNYGDATAAMLGVTNTLAQNLITMAEDYKTFDDYLAATGWTEAEAEAHGYTRALFDQTKTLLGVEKNTRNARDILKAYAAENGGAVPDVDAMAQGFLDQAKGSSELTASLVTQAQAQADANGVGDDAMQVYLAYIQIASGLSDAQMKLALDLNAAAAANATVTDKAQEAADATARQKQANEELKKAVGETTTELDLASEAADYLRNALDRLLSPAVNLEEASREYQAAIDDLTKSLTDNGNTLDITTEKGRANREAVQTAAEAARDFGVAMIENGYSADQAEAYVNAYNETLRQQLIDAGMSTQAVDEYLKTLGATPAQVKTAIELAGVEQRKSELSDIIDQLGDIDEGAAAEIQALIDAGAYDEAERRLRAIAAERNINLRVGVTGLRGVDVIARPGGLGVTVRPYATGGLVASPTLAALAETGRPEAVLPLTNPSRMSQLLSDPRIGGPVAAAMPQAGGLSIGVINVGDRRDYVELQRSLDLTLWRML